MTWDRNEWVPTRTERIMSAKAGSPTDREVYGDGIPIVVRDGSAVHRAKEDRKTASEPNGGAKCVFS